MGMDRSTRCFVIRSSPATATMVSKILLFIAELLSNDRMTRRLDDPIAGRRNPFWGGENSLLLLAHYFFVVRRQEDLAEQQQRAGHNCAVGNVKCRPVVSADVKVQKVHDPAAGDAVP